MKRIILCVIAVVMLLGNATVFAQRNNDFRYDMAGFAFDIRKINKLGEKPKYFKNPEHYYDFGVAYLNFYSRLIEKLEPNQSANEVKTDLYEQKSSEQVEINGIQLTKNSFEYDTENHYTLDLYYTPDDKLLYWKLNSEYPYALDTAAWAFMRAKAIGIRDADIANKLRAFTDRVRSYLELDAQANYKVKQYDQAYRRMRKAIEVMHYTGADSAYMGSSLFNAGFFAYQGGMYEESEKTMLEALAYKFKEPEDRRGGIYTILADGCRKRGDKEGAFKYSLMGAEAYPDLIDMIYEVINGYMANGEDEKALVYLNRALDLEPENVAVMLLKASVIEDAGNKEEAQEWYHKIVSIDPMNYKAWNHIAVYKYQHGRSMVAEAEKEDDNKVYRQKMREACFALYDAIEPLEKCVEIEPDAPGVKETLRSVYAAIRKELAKEHPELDKKFEALDAEIKAQQN
ncbi:MAG: hypothetical protein IKI72_07985 [Bacteroidales bacterium]|nr:hypothetical protein [Bacteroidales bacterium]